VTGPTYSTDFSGATNTYKGGCDAFVAKISGFGGGSVDLADLALDASDLSLTPGGGGYDVSATVWNKGSTEATNVLIRYRDTFNGAVVGAYTIGSLGSWTSFVLPDVRWTPSDPTALIEIYADPADNIAEERESNNYAFAAPGGAPAILDVRAEWDGDSDPYAFGRFVSGVELKNLFEVTIANPADVAEVTFTLGPLASKTDDDPYGGWSVDFDVGQLTGDATLEVVAYDSADQPLDSWTGTVHVVPFPSWLGSADEDDYFADSDYYLTGLFPEFMEKSFTMPEDLKGVPIPIIGGTETGFRVGVESQVVAPLSTSAEPECSVELVVFAKVFDETFLDVRYAPEFSAGYFSLSVSDLNVGGELLGLEGFDVTAEIENLPLGSYETPEFPIVGVGVPVLADITLRASAWIEADLDASLTLHFDGSGVAIADAWLGLDITGRGNLIGAGRFLAFGLAGSSLAADFDRSGSVDLADFAIMRGNFGNTLPAASAAPEAAAAALQAAGESIAAAPAPMVPVVGQPIRPLRQAQGKPLDGHDANNANDDSIASAVSAPAIDPFAESLSPTSYISAPQPMSVGSSATTPHRAATGGYDLRSLSDDLGTDGQADEVLADILAESPLAVPV